MIGNPDPVGYGAANDPSYWTVSSGESLWSIALTQVEHQRAAKGLDPLQGDDLTNATANELQLIEQANPQIVQQGGSGNYDLIWANDKIDIPNAPQMPGLAPQAGATPGTAVNGGEPGTVIPAGTTINTGAAFYSPNGRFELTMENGELILYKIDPVTQEKTKISQSSANGNGDYAVMEANGDLEIFSADRIPIWDSNTASSGNYNSDNSVLAIQDDGNLVIYSARGPIWDTAHHTGPNGEWQPIDRTSTSGGTSSAGGSGGS